MGCLVNPRRKALEAYVEASGIPVFGGVAVRFNVEAEGGLRATRPAVADALPAYLARGGPIHYMHGEKPVGYVLAHELGDDSLRIWFSITDRNSRRIVESGACTALSMGFAFNRRNDVVNGALAGLDLKEFSVGPRPACPDCRIDQVLVLTH